MPCEDCGSEDSSPTILLCPCCGEVDVRELCDACVKKVESQNRVHSFEEEA